jgi:hypothetical protein
VLHVFINGGRLDPRLRIDDSIDLSDLVDALRSYCRSKSVESAGTGVADCVAATKLKFLNYAGGNSRRLTSLRRGTKEVVASLKGNKPARDLMVAQAFSLCSDTKTITQTKVCATFTDYG